jgi:hypothetical protein
MKNNKPPMWGEYVKLISTGEIVKNEGFNPTTRMMTIKPDNGIVSDVAWDEIERITGNEEVDFLLSRKQKPN